MRALFASPLGFGIGVALGALGGGGSILAVPVLVHAAGQSASNATTTSLLVVAGASLVGLVGHWRAGRVRPRSGAVFGLVGLGGSIAGTALNQRVEDDLLLAGFALLIVVAAHRMFVSCPGCTRAGEQGAISQGGDAGAEAGEASSTALDVRRTLIVAVAGTGVGFLTGLFGVGGGFVIVPALTLVLGLTMADAVGTSLLVITVNAALALAARGGPAAVEWGVAIPFTLAALLGVAAGVRAADQLDGQSLQRWFAVLLVAVSLYTGTDAVLGLVG